MANSWKTGHLSRFFSLSILGMGRVGWRESWELGEGEVGLFPKKLSKVSFSSKISIDSLLTSHGKLFLFDFVFIFLAKKGKK